MGYNIPSDHHGPLPQREEPQANNAPQVAGTTGYTRVQLPDGSWAETSDGVTWNVDPGALDRTMLAAVEGDKVVASCIVPTPELWRRARERALIAFESPQDFDKALAAFAEVFGIYPPGDPV